METLRLFGFLTMLLYAVRNRILYGTKGGTYMATYEQLKQLIKAHYRQDQEQFQATVLQIAAAEERDGYARSAKEIKELIIKPTAYQSPAKQEEVGASDLLERKRSTQRLQDLILSKAQEEQIKQILLEYRKQDRLSQYGLHNKRKILLAGPSGTGKTMTASVIASELQLPLYVLMADKMITRFLGETNARLRQVFETMKRKQGVYLLDEFDAIGIDRSMEQDVGEMRRLVNSLLQFLEQDESNSIILAATNYKELLDRAFQRRFDDVITYQLPQGDDIRKLAYQKLERFMPSSDLSRFPWSDFHGLSHAQIVKICEDAIKQSILQDRTAVTIDQLQLMIRQIGRAHV